MQWRRRRTLAGGGGAIHADQHLGRYTCAAAILCWRLRSQRGGPGRPRAPRARFWVEIDVGGRLPMSVNALRAIAGGRGRTHGSGSP